MTATELGEMTLVWCRSLQAADKRERLREVGVGLEGVGIFEF